MKITKKLRSLTMLLKEKNEVPICCNVDNKMLLKGKVIWIVGATGGIGYEITNTFLSSGASIIVSGTSQRKMEMIKTKFIDYSNNIKCLPFNLSKTCSYDEKITTAVSLFGKIDALVFAAGVHSESYDFFEMDEIEYERVLKINLEAPFFLCQKLSKYMIENKIKGHILFISSSRGSEPAYTPYGISKWGLNGFVKGLAQKLIEKEIIVNSISPGATATGLIGIKEGDSIFSYENKVNRLIMPQEIANLALLMISHHGDMIVGETIHISGGRGVFDIR